MTVFCAFQLSGTAGHGQCDGDGVAQRYPPGVAGSGWDCLEAGRDHLAQDWRFKST